MLDDPNDFVIIDGVISLARSFNLDVIAEGVETVEQGMLLLLLGCNYAQGFGIAKPMPAEDVKSWLNNFEPTKSWLHIFDKTTDDKHKKALIFKLVATQWLNRFLYNIEAASGQQRLWPSLDHGKCHCGRWIARAKFEQRYESDWLELVEENHITMHTIAIEIFEQYRNGRIHLARQQKDKLHSAFDSLISHMAN